MIFPQAMRRFLPPWINSVTDAVKGSALVSLVGIVDLMLAIQQVIGRTYEPMPLYILGAADLLRDQLRAVAAQPRARGAVRLCPMTLSRTGPGARCGKVVRRERRC